MKITRPFVLGLFLILITGQQVASLPNIIGHWKGQIEIPQTPLGVVVNLVQNEDGSWAGTIDIPMQGAVGLPLRNISVEDSNVSFTIEGPPGNPTFNGTLSPDGASIDGDFSQAGQTFPFGLKRTGDARTTEGPSAEEALSGFDEFIREGMKKWDVPGMGIAIVKDGGPILIKGYGYRNVEEQLPVTEDTEFAIGSSSKAFTTLVLGMLVDEGVIEWDEPVRTYLPTFELEDEFASERMTPRDLVCHRSGLPRHDFVWYGSPLSREELFDRLTYLESNVDFRTEFQYQNLMFMTAGYLAGQVTGTSWESLVMDRIFEPLGMDNSNLSVDDMRGAPDFAYGYQKKENEDTGEDEIRRMPFRDIDAMGPAGSINSTVLDMSKWVQFQLAGGNAGDTRVVSSQTMQELHRPQIVVHGGMISQLFTHPEMPHIMYGLGWFVQPYRGHEMLHHGGNIDGFSALVAFMPKDNVGVVVLTNLNGTPFPTVVMLNVFDRLLGLDEIDWNGRYKLVWAKVKEGGDQAKTMESINRKSGTETSHRLDDYTGVYTHPAYGSIEVTESGDTLMAARNGITVGLEHWHYDVFRTTDGPIEGLKIAFLTNLNGDIDRISAAMEQAVDAVEFLKEPPREMFERDFLEQFVGDYDLMGMVVTERFRDDNTLTVIAPGQPPYELDPYMGTEFKLKDHKQYSVKFVIEKGDVTQAVFIQPNGVFAAKKN